jgi:hypothetical protein
MLNKADIGPITPDTVWLVLWQEEHKDKNGNDAPHQLVTCCSRKRSSDQLDDILIN